jgi:hypothetical protein
MTVALPRYRVRLLHLTAVWAYGVTQPVFALIDGNPDLLVSRDVTWTAVALFSVLLAIVPPALLTGYAWLAGKYSPWIGDRVYLFALGVCLVPIAARALKLLDPAFALAAGLLGLLAIGGVVAYARWRPVRMFVGYSIVLPALSVLWFVHGLPDLTTTAEAADVRVTSPTPVVLIVLDEMAGSSLMTRDGELDSVRYPNFARLAREGTWYRNATTVHAWTTDAVPSILSGLIGDDGGAASLQNHPDNLFTLLGGSYSLHVRETWTRLCPRTECPRPQPSALETSYELLNDGVKLLVPRVLPESLSEHITVRDRVVPFTDLLAYNRFGELDGMLDEFSRSRTEKVLLYSHQLLPHAPWRFLPSGAQYDGTHVDGLYATEYWADDPWLVLQGYQRYLLQVGYVDAFLGRVLRTLDRAGLYDRTLIVVTADHGVSFRAGDGRRHATETNIGDIANMPLFVKYPNQTRRGVDSRPVHTVDILPTIAQVLGVRIPWEVDGVSLLGPIPNRDVVVTSHGEVVHASLAEMRRNRAETLRHKADEFGEGNDSLLRIGRNKALLGRDVSDVVERSPGVDVEVENEAALRNVRPASGFLPARISCHVSAGRLEEGVELAIAVNGRVRGLTTWFWDDLDDVQRFRSLVPEGSIHPGANQVDVFLVRGNGADASLARIGSSGT